MNANSPRATALEGVYSAIVTPFDAAGDLDEVALGALIEGQMRAGVRGAVVAGSTGEGSRLTDEEWRRATRAALAAASADFPVVTQVSAESTREAVRRTEWAAEANASGGLLMIPHPDGLSDRELHAHVEAVAAVGLPIMLYNYPGSAGASLSVVQVAQIAEIPGVSSLKDSQPDSLTRAFEIDRLTGGRLQVMAGWDTLMLPSFLCGVRAAVWGAVTAIPEACVSLFDLAAVRRDLDAAGALWRDLFPVLDFFFSTSYVPAVKMAARLRGIDAGHCRLPASTLEESQVSELDRRLQALEHTVAAVSPAPDEVA